MIRHAHTKTGKKKVGPDDADRTVRSLACNQRAKLS